MKEKSFETESTSPILSFAKERRKKGKKKKNTRKTSPNE